MNAATQLKADQWVDICSEDDLIPDSGIAALVGDKQVAIYYLPTEQQKIFALDNHDPFSGANVLSRGILGDLQGRLVVASPIYKQHFDLTNGECLEDTETRIGAWPVKLEEGRVWIAG